MIGLIISSVSLEAAIKYLKIAVFMYISTKLLTFRQERIIAPALRILILVNTKMWLLTAMIIQLICWSSLIFLWNHQTYYLDGEEFLSINSNQLHYFRRTILRKSHSAMNSVVQHNTGVLTVRWHKSIFPDWYNSISNN